MHNKTISTFKNLRKGNSRMIETTFNGRTVCGGYFYTATKHYVKKVKPEHKHPYMDSYSIDLPIIKELEHLGCITIEVKVSGTKQAYYIPLTMYLKKMLKPRFYENGKFPPRTNVLLSNFATKIEELNDMLNKEGAPDGESAA